MCGYSKYTCPQARRASHSWEPRVQHTALWEGNYIFQSRPQTTTRLHIPVINSLTFFWVYSIGFYVLVVCEVFHVLGYCCL